MKKSNSERSHLEKGIASDGTRFGFVNRLGKGIGSLLQKVNMIIHQLAESKPYKIDYKHVESEYLKLGVGDIDEFASSYTFGWAMLPENDFLSDSAVKQAVYEEVRTYLWQKWERGEIR